MTVFLDTSVVLRVLFRQTNRLATWGKWQKAYASRLWYTEALRTIDRLRLNGEITDADVAQLRTDIDLIHATLFIVPVTEAILVRAEGPFPAVLGTLDALHLASALEVKAGVGVDCLFTHDVQLAVAARCLGLTVGGV